MNSELDTASFKALTGNAPLRWQTRLYKEHFINGAFPPVIDIPTGLGKTMIMAIWLIARALHPGKVPTRLIYVVDRRTVVDQATDLAQKLRDNCKQALGIEPPAISTLRGQLADNREWSRDPSKPAIIIGTVDLIGSALLFSGYRSSYKRRPLEAGLLGQDSLLVLDEAHLSKPFEKLLIGAQQEDGTRSNGIEQFQAGQGKPLCVIRMSATNTGGNGESFTLEGDYETSTRDFSDERVRQRYGAVKRLTVITLGEKEDLNKKLTEAAIGFAQKPDLVGKRIVVFVRKPDDATKIADAIRKHESTKTKSGPYADSVEVLTGTMRGLERDELVEKPVLKRFLDGEEKPDLEQNKNPVFLISTSAGEVGFDLNADHMVCDATTIDSLIQRLGRVNRRGLGEAQVHLFAELAKKEKDGKPKKLEGLDLAINNTLQLLQGIKDVSPKDIAALRSSRWKDIYAAACSPAPTTVELTDILLDAWSMTSITKPMPGRPQVGPWVRGINDQQAQTTVTWRAELELFAGDSSLELEQKTLQAIFIKHRIRPHESLTVNTAYLLEFLKQIPKLKDRPPDLMTTKAAIRFPGGHVVRRTLQQVVDNPGILYADSMLILPAKFGGLDGAGLLDADSIPKKRKEDDPALPSLDRADHAGYEQREGAEPRLRVLIRRNESDQWTAHAMSGSVAIPNKIKPAYDRSNDLINALTSDGLRLRLVQPIKFDDEGDPTESLVLLSSVSSKGKLEDQSLSDHVSAVKVEAERIADALKLTEGNLVRIALLYAAKWHDEGKKAEIWQTYANGPMDDGSYRGKSRRYRDPKFLKRTRHEVESLLRIAHPAKCNTENCVLPNDPTARDLALHFITVHHGFGRPHFPAAPYRDFTTDEFEAIHTESIRRFARLQRKYGWWRLAWLENLLRCADALASADNDAEDDPADSEGDGQ